MIHVMNGSLKGKGMEINEDKTKVLMFEREESNTKIGINKNGKTVYKEDKFVYLGYMFSRDDRCMINEININ